MSATIESLRTPAKRGPKKPHSGQFAKGFDARRASPIKRNLMEAVAEAAQESAPRAIKFLEEVMDDPKEAVKVRLIAAKEILDRSIGQSVSMSVHKDLSNPEDTRISQLSSSPPADLSDAQLLLVIQDEVSQRNQEATAIAPPGELAEEAEFSEVPESDPTEVVRGTSSPPHTTTTDAPRRRRRRRSRVPRDT